MKDKFRECILSGKLDDAKKLVENYDDEQISEFLLAIAFEEECLSAYSFVCMLINDNETSERHYLASELVNTALCHFQGSYQVGLFHARKSIELDPKDITLKEYLLFFHDIPEKLVSDEEAYNIANEILKVNKESIVALRIIRKHKNSKDY